jgi:Sulfotransferase family
LADIYRREAVVADDDLLRKPILVLGAPRSGTATLAGVLKAHPDVAYLREPRLVWRVGNDDKSDMLEPSDARAEVRARIRSTFASMVREQGRSRMLEKTPSNSLRIGFIDQIFPDCLVIHILRDGPDAIAAIRRKWLETPHGLSNPRHRDRLRRHLREVEFRQLPRYGLHLGRQLLPRSLAPVVGRRTWGPRLPGMDGLVRDLELLDVCALQWRTCVERACQAGRALGPDRYMEVRLEELSLEVIKDVASFCDLDPAPVTDEYARLYDPDKIVPRGDGLDVDERRRVMTWIEPTTAWLNGGGTPEPDSGF